MSNENVTPLKAPPSTGGDFEQVPVGVYVARCFRMVDLGTQETTFGGATKMKRQVMLFFELLQDDEGEDVRMGNGEPFTISKTYTFSLHSKAALRQDLDAWRGKPFTDDQAKDFDLTNLLGVHCLLQVTHNESNGKTWANIGTIMTTKKQPEGVNPISSFSALAPNMNVFEQLPDWIKDKIRSAEEWEVENEKGGITKSGEVKPNPEGLTQEEVDATPF